MFWSAGREEEMYRAFSSDPDTECTYYPEEKKYAIVNNSLRDVTATFYDMQGKEREIKLGAHRILWVMD